MTDAPKSIYTGIDTTSLFLSIGLFRNPNCQFCVGVHQAQTYVDELRSRCGAIGIRLPERIEVVGPDTAMGLYGPATLCASAWKNAWLIVIPAGLATCCVEHQKAILAHELSHIAAHGLKQRIVRAIGQLSLLGTSVLLPLVRLEDEEREADALARKILGVRDGDEAYVKAILCVAASRLAGTPREISTASWLGMTSLFILGCGFPINPMRSYGLRRSVLGKGREK